jgi:hypothetical protein
VLASIISSNGARAFTSKELSNELVSQPNSYLLNPKEINTKRISNDLDRLYRMRFLKRRRQKRMVVNKYGANVRKGFEYVYSISKQGKSYLYHLYGPKKVKEIDPLGYLPPIIRLIEEAFERPKRSAEFFARDFPVPKTPGVPDMSKLSEQDVIRYQELAIKYTTLKKKAQQTLNELDRLKLKAR